MFRVEISSWDLTFITPFSFYFDNSLVFSSLFVFELFFVLILKVRQDLSSCEAIRLILHTVGVAIHTMWQGERDDEQERVGQVWTHMDILFMLYTDWYKLKTSRNTLLGYKLIIIKRFDTQDKCYPDSLFSNIYSPHLAKFV